jgi:hypothetical protein
MRLTPKYLMMVNETPASLAATLHATAIPQAAAADRHFAGGTLDNGVFDFESLEQAEISRQPCDDQQQPMIATLRPGKLGEKRRLLLDSGACESIARPGSFGQPIDTSQASTLWAVNDTPIRVEGARQAFMKLDGELAQIGFSVTGATAEDILAVCKQMDAGFDVRFCRRGCYISSDDGQRIAFYREGDRFYLDYEVHDGSGDEAPKMMAPISDDNHGAMQVEQGADDGLSLLEPFDPASPDYEEQ